jgi:hypothetical protein
MRLGLLRPSRMRLGCARAVALCGILCMRQPTDCGVLSSADGCRLHTPYRIRLGSELELRDVRPLLRVVWRVACGLMQQLLGCGPARAVGGRGVPPMHSHGIESVRRRNYAARGACGPGTRRAREGRCTRGLGECHCCEPASPLKLQLRL